MDRNRVDAGVPSGGQFAKTAHAEGTVTLTGLAKLKQEERAGERQSQQEFGRIASSNRRLDAENRSTSQILMQPEAGDPAMDKATGAPDLTYLAMTKDYRIMDRRDGSILPDDHLSEDDKRRIDPYTREAAAPAPARKRDRLRNWFRKTSDEADRELETMSAEWAENARRALGGQ